MAICGFSRIFLPTFLSCLPAFLPSYLPTFLPSLPSSPSSPSFLPSHSLPSFTSSYLPSFKSSFLPPFTSPYLPSFTSSFLPSRRLRRQKHVLWTNKGAPVTSSKTQPSGVNPALEQEQWQGAWPGGLSDHFAPDVHAPCTHRREVTRVASGTSQSAPSTRNLAWSCNAGSLSFRPDERARRCRGASCASGDSGLRKAVAHA